MSSAPSLALVVNTFNQPDYLLRLLNALNRQTQLPQEVVVADDGSDDQTRAVFEGWAARQSFPCSRVWQEHAGFRRARILNLAIARAASTYLVFQDGDTIPHPAFVADHLRLARPGTFVQGHRALIGRSGASFFGLGDFAADRRRGGVGRHRGGLPGSLAQRAGAGGDRAWRWRRSGGRGAAAAERVEAAPESLSLR